MKKGTLVILAIIFLIISLSVSIYSIYLSSINPLTNLENILFQIFIFIFSILGSFIFGNIFVVKSQEELIRPHARSALRRVVSLYKTMSGIVANIAETKSKYGKANNQLIDVLEKYEFILTQNILTIDDSLNDWKDIIPKDVDELQRSSFEETNENGK